MVLLVASCLQYVVMLKSIYASHIQTFYIKHPKKALYNTLQIPLAKCKRASNFNCAVVATCVSIQQRPHL